MNGEGEGRNGDGAESRMSRSSRGSMECEEQEGPRLWTEARNRDRVGEIGVENKE